MTNARQGDETMTHKRRTRFWTESALAAASGVLCAATLINAEWIEAVFHVDPDGGSGALEWAIVASLLALSLLAGGLARREWRGVAVATGSGDAA